MSFASGELVFVKHPKHSWVAGTVISCDKATASVKCNDPHREVVGEVLDKIKLDDVTSCREDLLEEAPDDLLQLTVLHDATLLRCLHTRYFKDIVYTNIGAIVVALNPFNFKIPWYMDDQMPKYLAEGPVIEKNLPHSWAQAHNTYNEMLADAENQCILISGESGAGKTEATKIVMKYLAQISCKKGSDADKAAGLQVGARLNSCSPILEAFGNAKTVRNDNSSRFGKFMKVKFLDTGRLVGAHTTKYLLEKSRIVTAGQGERVYHAFYLAPRGSMSSKIGLEDIASYKSVNSGGTLTNSEFSTAEDFAEVCNAMTVMGMTQEEITSVWMCTGGILSLLNLTFGQEGEGSAVAPATRKYLDHAVKVWRIDGKDLEKQLTTKTLVLPGGEKNVCMLRPSLATDARDALTKALYNGMFGWLVDKSNQMCDVDAKTGNWIGLLDIFGFEDFAKNSFEQLCINLANETLQNHYNTYIFEKDMAECRAEGIDVTEVKCPDNMPCLRLITEKGGILSLLDEECLLGKGTDLTFLEKVDFAHGNNKNAFFEKKKNASQTFIVHHYAASVVYDVIGWLEKNRDTLTDDVRRMMRASNDTLIKEFIEAPVPDQKGRRTVGGFFKEQVAELMRVINGTNPHWIRCVKPHPAKKARMFDGIQTMNQLESSGVLGTVKIRKAGYPIRMTFAKFNIRYKIIVSKDGAKKDERTLSQAILTAVQMTDKKFAQVGKTKIFMKSEAFPLIERKRNEFLLGHAMRLQRTCRAFQARLAANRARARAVQERFSTLLITEYREYTKRSAAEREERARIRREAEIKFRGLREQCERDAAQSLTTLFNDWNATWGTLAAERERVITEERARMERNKGERDQLVRAEYNARNRIFDDLLGVLQNLKDLRISEVSMFFNFEVNFTADQERAAREVVIEDETNERAKLRVAYMRLHTRACLVALELSDDRFRRFLSQLENLQRSEIVARVAIMRHHRAMIQHIAKEKATDKHAAKVKMHHRKQFEKWKDRELFMLEQLRRDELFRLYSSRGGAPSGSASAADASAALLDTVERELAMVEARTDLAAPHAAAARPASEVLKSVEALSSATPMVGARGSALLRRDVPTYDAVERATPRAAASPMPTFPPAATTLLSGGESSAYRPALGQPLASPAPASPAAVREPIPAEFGGARLNPLLSSAANPSSAASPSWASPRGDSLQDAAAAAALARNTRSLPKPGATPTTAPTRSGGPFTPTSTLLPYDAPPSPPREDEPPLAYYPSPERVAERSRDRDELREWKRHQWLKQAAVRDQRHADAATASLDRWIADGAEAGNNDRAASGGGANPLNQSYGALADHLGALPSVGSGLAAFASTFNNGGGGFSGGMATYAASPARQDVAYHDPLATAQPRYASPYGGGTGDPTVADSRSPSHASSVRSRRW